MAMAARGILGHKSAHSFPIGPVISDPSISPFGFTITPALSSNYMKTPPVLRHSLHWRTITAGMTLLCKSGLLFLVIATDTSGGKPVKSVLDPLHRYDVEVPRARVVGTIHDHRNRQTQ
ncbi:UNVERIFIED_CONTAM: hypothetical protein Sindi_0488100 [Sesamum indicum]